MHIHEILNKPIEDYEVERKRLETLFTNTAVVYLDLVDRTIGKRAPSLIDCLSDSFNQSQLRGTATNIYDFFSSLAPHWAKPSLEGLLLYCEILASLLAEFELETGQATRASEVAVRIERNIAIILEKTGHYLHKRDDGFIEILQKDALAATVVEDLTDAEAARAVLDYTHYGLKGNLEKKRELLRIIGHYVEPILQDAEMKGSYGWLINDLGCCLNSLHIRHNNKEGKKANAVAQAMSDAELESCYDNTYRELLLLIELQKNLPFHRKVEVLRGQLDGKKDGRKG